MKWVIAEQLAIWHRPGREMGRQPVRDEAVVRTWLAAVQSSGVRSIICLLDHRQLQLYQQLPRPLLQCYREAGFEVAHVPVEDYRQPPLTQDELGAVAAAWERLARPILLHCSAGIDRSCYAAEHLRQLETSRSA